MVALGCGVMLGFGVGDVAFARDSKSSRDDSSHMTIKITLAWDGKGEYSLTGQN